MTARMLVGFLGWAVFIGAVSVAAIIWSTSSAPPRWEPTAIAVFPPVGPVGWKQLGPKDGVVAAEAVFRRPIERLAGHCVRMATGPCAWCVDEAGHPRVILCPDAARLAAFEELVRIGEGRGR